MSSAGDGERLIAGWIPPTVAYIVLVGAEKLTLGRGRAPRASSGAS